MSSNSTAAQAAALLVARRINGSQGERLPEACRPLDLESALAIQSAVADAWCEQMDDSVGGWKCLLPSPDRIVVAPIFTRTIDSVAPVALWPKGNVPRIEPEFVFFFDVDLPVRPEPYTPAEVDAAVVRTHMALELLNSRYQDPSECEFPEMLADGLVNQGLYIGPEIDSNQARGASSFTISVTAKGETNLHQGKHPNTLPRAPLYWLVEFLRSRGVGISAGQAVITGSYAGVIEVPLNEDLHIGYAGLGSMRVSFTARTNENS